MTQRLANLKPSKRAVLSALFVAFCAMGGGESAVASCGDYLHKRGSDKQSQAEMPMESHSDNRCENQRHDPLPVVPPPVPERENDQLASRQLTVVATEVGSGWDHHSDCSTAMAGFQSRVDRPPQR